MSTNNSYRQILHASSIIGGANALSFIVGLIRIKIIAVFLGPSGVGLVSLYTSVVSLIGTVSGMGVTSSGVREVAKVLNTNDPIKVATNIIVLRRVSFWTGVLGWLLVALFAQPISILVFSSPEHASSIAILGVILLIGAVSGGQTAMLQGMRKIRDLARINIITMLINTVVTIALYAWLKEQGIIPVLISIALVTLLVSSWFSQRIKIEQVILSLSQTISGARRLFGLGFALMWSALLVAGLDFVTRSIITHEYGMNAVGIYQAAWALSGTLAGFVLNAMGMDFYPRLTSVIEDNANACRTVNEQTEIGMMLAIPGLLCTLTFAPVTMELFYTRDFLQGAVLLPWFLLGVFGRVVSFPLGYIQLAKGASHWFIATETIFTGLQITLNLMLVPRLGIVGAAYSVGIVYVGYTLVSLWVGRLLIGFKWSKDVKRLLLFSLLLLLIGVGLRILLPGWQGNIAGSALAFIGCILSLKELSVRLESDHPLIIYCSRVPVIRFIINNS